MEAFMRFRGSSLVDDVRAFDEPSDWSPLPELTLIHERTRAEDPTFRALLDDPEACWHWELS
jgi:hypothetical protein